MPNGNPIRSIHVQNFRGLSDVNLESLSTVNVFIGKNSVGKTSLLEAAYLTQNPLTSKSFAQLAWSRDFPRLMTGNSEPLRALFPGMDLSRRPVIKFVRNGVSHEIGIEPIQRTESETMSFKYPMVSNAELDGGEEQFLGVNVYLSTPPKPPKVTRIELTSEGLIERTVSVQIPTGDGSSQRRMSTEVGVATGFYINARRATSPVETAVVLTRLIEQRKLDVFIDAMRVLEPRIKSIVPGTRGQTPIVLVDVGLPNLVPMQVLGDGFCRLALFVTGLLDERPSSLIIDEIDSGFHHSVMPDLWARLLSLAVSRKFQVFATTHNEEMLQALLPAFLGKSEHLRLVRLDRSKDGMIQATVIPYESLKSASDLGLEIR